MDYVDIAIKLAVITLLSGLIGLDRELKHKPAGAKTHILVGLGATIFTIVSIHIFMQYKGMAQVDPGRIAAQVVTGIGFLGAGTIIQSGGNVLGLTTAASLWAVAGIGLAVGTGMYFLAIASAVVMLFVFLITNRLTDLVEKKVDILKGFFRPIKKGKRGK